MSGTYLWTECGYRHAASWRFFIFTVPSHKTEDQLTHSSWRLRDTSFRCSSVKPEIDLCAFDRKQPPHDDTKRAQLPHGELAADWSDSRFCTLSNPRQPVLPGQEYSGESIARVIDASADVAFIRCVGNPVLERRDTLHGRLIFFFFFFDFVWIRRILFDWWDAYRMFVDGIMRNRAVSMKSCVVVIPSVVPWFS